MSNTNPFYYRSSDFLYLLKGHSEYGLAVYTKNGFQFLVIGIPNEKQILKFSHKGDFLGFSACEIPEISEDSDEAIKVKRFWLSGNSAGIEDVDSDMKDYLTNKGAFSIREATSYETDFKEWENEGLYVFWIQGTECFVDSEGDISST